MTNSTVQLQTTVQMASTCQGIPATEKFEQWVTLVLQDRLQQAEVCIRIVDQDEIQQLNRDYRKQDKATNVLSFPSQLPEETFAEFPVLGDIVICAPVILQEAQQQDKLLEAHWAHMTIHGLLHLLGHDHVDESQAQMMEQLEINFLQQLGFNNPYEDEVTHVG